MGKSKGKSKKSIEKSISSLLQQIDDHMKKVDEAKKTGKNLHMIPHWKKEIQNFDDRLMIEKKRLQKK